ncbi:MAG: HAMP domain-containing histidine kinase [Gemmatimonadetes bacterium]|nr:HAMP domain-containing histidine kinase [Gemmatimonadota bacterium]
MPLAPDARRWLDEAAEALVEEWRGFAVDAISQGEVAAAVAGVVAQIVEAAAGRPRAPEPSSPLDRRVVALLRRHLLEHDEAVPPGGLRPVLRALEQVAASMEPRWTERFQERMTGPSGLDLVVEVAHDLRSPLTSILFLAEIMLRGRSGPLTPLQERQLGLVYSAAFGLNAVASDVIELVRGGDRLVGREPQPFSVAEVLESVRDIVRPIAEEKGLELHFEGPGRDRRVGHPGALNRVLLNLTTNALKFSSAGHVEVTLTDGAGLALDCTVRDTGRGIPEAAMATLFEPFRRRQQPGDYAFSGSGLGLSICRKLVEAMGSTLEVSAVAGEGTCFQFTLQLPEADPAMLIG